MVKITPAHDPNDFEVGNRHNLERVIVMNPDATMNENAGIYKGLNRNKLVEDLKEIEKFFIGVINTRKNNLYYSFISYQELILKRDRDILFYINDLDGVYEDYYENEKI